MKFLSLGLGVFLISTVTLQTISAQTPSTVRLIGCLQGDGSEQKPWVLAGAALPPPPAPAPAAGGGGGGGRGAGAGGAGAATGQAGAPAGQGAAGGGGRGGGGRGGGGRGAGGAATPAPPPAPVQLADFRLTGGLNMSIWRGMKVEVEGVLGARPASGLQELRAMSARSVQGLCTPK